MERSSGETETAYASAMESVARRASCTHASRLSKAMPSGCAIAVSNGDALEQANPARRFSVFRLLLMGVLAFTLFGVCAGCASGTSQSESAPASTSGATSSNMSESGKAGGEGESGATAAKDAEGKPPAGAFEADPAYDELKSEVESVFSDSVIDVGVAFVDLSDVNRIAGFSVNGKMPLVSASMIKLAILAEFLEEVEKGELSLEEPYTLQADDIVGGTGSVQSAGAGSVHTLGELARLMICDSDNTAANVLVKRMGMDAVNDQMKELGLENTQLNRLMMDEEAIAQHKENFMSAEDAAVLLARIYRGQLVSETASAFALEALEAQSDSVGLAQGLPEGVVFAHKTGTLAMVKNDGGIVEAKKPYVLVVFCSGADQSVALDLMNKVSALVYERFE